MTTIGRELSNFLSRLLGDEDAAQRYLLDPEAALADAGLSAVTASEINAAAEDFEESICRTHGGENGERSPNRHPRVATSSPGSGDIIRNLLLHKYTSGNAYHKILSEGGLSDEFGPSDHERRASS
jgi:hypothetical protein